jgi:hypothetical protein
MSVQANVKKGNVLTKNERRLSERSANPVGGRVATVVEDSDDGSRA